MSNKKSEISKVVKPSNKTLMNDSIESLRELLVRDIEIVSTPRKQEIDEKILKISANVAELYSQVLNWDEIQKESGKQEYLVTLEQIYNAYGENHVTDKQTERTKINTPIYVSLSRELHKKEMDINQTGSKGKMKTTNGKTKDVFVVKIKPLELKEYQEVNSDGDIVTKSGWIVDSLSKSIMTEDLDRNNMYLLNLEFYRTQGHEKDENFSILVEKGSNEEKKLLECEEKDKEESEKDGILEEE